MIRQAIGGEAVVRTIHRLDSVVSGVMVYALTKEAASGLGAQMEDGTFHKEYMAVTEGRPAKDKGEYRDYLLRNKRERKTYVADRRNRDAQEAILTYQVAAKRRENTLVRVQLITGRTHQIRCQFSSRGLPLFGDRKYGSVHGDAGIALWCHRLDFRHPTTGEKVSFSALPPAKLPWTSFRGFTENYNEEDLKVEFKRSETFSDCPFAEDCGFCTYQGMEYEKQLEKKQRKAVRFVRELGPVEPILGMEEPSGYRHKATWNLGLDRNGRLVSGIYSRKAHRVLRIGRCRIDHPKLVEIAAAIRALLVRYEIPIYEEATKVGCLRQMTIRVTTAGKVMVVLTAAAELPKEADAMLEELMASHPEIRSVLLETGQKNHREVKVLRGEESLEETWMGQPFRIDSASSFPINPAQSKVVCDTALEYAALTGAERVLDVSCGIGALALAAADRAGKVLAVDASEAAIREAGERAEQMGRGKQSNLRFVHAEPEVYLEALARSRESIDVLFVEATRCRKTAECVAAIGRLKPGTIVYIGRDPERMGEDMHALVRHGYAVRKIRPVDLLPFAETAETVVLLSRDE